MELGEREGAVNMNAFKALSLSLTRIFRSHPIQRGTIELQYDFK
jgi:hypothetical protein